MSSAMDSGYEPDMGLDVGSDTRSNSDVASITSSVEWINQEPFETFRNRVLDLALHKIWPDAAEDEIHIERMIGGGYNRIIGISRITPRQPGISTQYILRTPRNDDVPVESQVRTLQFLRKHYNFPTPNVISFDPTDNNELGVRYMIQDRIHGTPLLSLYPSLTHEEKCRVARELGHIYYKMIATQSATSTIIVPPEKETIADPPVLLDIHSMLLDVLHDWKAAEIARCKDGIMATLIDNFCNIVQELETDGYFVDCHISLAHLDMHPRNIMLNPTSDTEQPIVSGILDWDSAVFAPQFMCCAPPLWLWAWNDDDDEDERTADELPPTPEGRQLKQLFEDAAGLDYARFAYLPAYRLARQLVRFAADGTNHNESFQDAQAIVKEWKEYHHDPIHDSYRESATNITPETGIDSIPGSDPDRDDSASTSISTAGTSDNDESESDKHASGKEPKDPHTSIETATSLYTDLWRHGLPPPMGIS
ncbi:kinase-like domain-containing protein [Daldinia sp. FL1419]|nr:kinase-like domain-containing protein [Daldinia sp. FL1419]